MLRLLFWCDKDDRKMMHPCRTRVVGKALERISVSRGCTFYFASHRIHLKKWESIKRKQRNNKTFQAALKSLGLYSHKKEVILV